MPAFSQAFLVEGKATWWKLQSVLSLVRYLGGSEHLAWTLQWIMTVAKPRAKSSLTLSIFSGEDQRVHVERTQ
jgi:hypothetical protein